jgi:hypothetical protein
MLLMITGVGTAVFVYAGGYLAGHPQQRRLYVLLTLFMLAMIGCVTADHLIVLFLFWELTSLTVLPAGRLRPPAGRQPQVGAAGAAGHRHRRAGAAGRLHLLGQAMGTYSISAIVERCRPRADAGADARAAADPGRLPSPRARSSRSTSGCPTRWRRRRRCRPTCTRPPW